MLTSSLARCCLLFFSYAFIGLAYANTPNADPLQVYRDEIKQSESSASQAVLDALKAHTDPDDTSRQNQTRPESPTATPAPRSNSDKAFTPADNQSAHSTHASSENPWLKPNPWANSTPNRWEQDAHVNPYSNAPIPGPAPSSTLTIPSPPNIFAPSRQSPNTNQPQRNANP